MTTLESIVNEISTVTGYMPVVKGGNRSNPIEYLYTPQSSHNYQLEIDLHGTNILSLTNSLQAICRALEDFGDKPKIDSCSITRTGGNSFSKDNIVTMVLYFDVIDYDEIRHQTV